jgi:hypothetical protein
VFGNADGYLMHREEDGRYYEIRGRNLGLQSRDIQVEGGDQGKYKLFLEYDQLPSFNDDTTRSPYRGRYRMPARKTCRPCSKTSRT